MSKQSEFVGARVSPQLADALAQASVESGKGVSELVREAIEAKLAEFRSDEDVVDLGGYYEINPFSHLAAASRGSREALRALAQEAIRIALSGRDDVCPERSLLEGLVFARLAAAQGDPADHGLVISMIALLAHIVGEENVPGEMGEAIARAEWAANQPESACEELTAKLVEMIEQASPEVIHSAKFHAELMREGSPT